MRKIWILSFIVVSLLSGCVAVDSEDVEQCESERFEIRTPKYRYVVDVVEFNYKGHLYIGFDGSSRMNGIIHSPNCPKCKHESSY